MPPRSNLARIARIRKWILILTLIPAAVALVAGHGSTAAGLAAGGIIILLNLLGTQRAVIQFLEGEGIERLAAGLLWLTKFGITAAVILGLLYSRTVGPLALLVGLGSLPASLVFDIFLFPVNKGEAKKP
jgi:hypothetical protein